MGNLPSTRTQTVNDSEPFPSNLINEIQDCIVGSFYPTTTLIIGGDEFVTATGAPVRSGLLWTFQTAGNASSIVHSLRLPVGVTVRAAAFSCRPNGDSLTVSVRRRSMGDGGLSDTAIEPQTYSGGASWAYRASGPTPGTDTTFTIADNFAYYLVVASVGAASQGLFDGVRLRHDKLT
jgi:hypothetical protein